MTLNDFTVVDFIGIYDFEKDKDSPQTAQQSLNVEQNTTYAKCTAIHQKFNVVKSLKFLCHCVMLLVNTMRISGRLTRDFVSFVALNI